MNTIQKQPRQSKTQIFYFQLLEQLLQQQNQNEDLVNKLQLQKDSERNRLIDDILKGKTDTALDPREP